VNGALHVCVAKVVKVVVKACAGMWVALLKYLIGQH